jgi:gluconokinase
MQAGVQLDDIARKPWLEAICRCADSHFSRKQSVVIACSALKSGYRTALRSVSRPVGVVFL